MPVIEKKRKSAGKRYGKWLIFLTMLLVGVTSVVIWRFRTRMPLLLDIATQVVPKERFNGPEFAWLSNDEYVCFRQNIRALCRYRVSSGVSTQLGRQLNIRSSGQGLKVSSNGEWLLWTEITSAGQFGDLLLDEPRLTHLKDGHTRAPNAFSGLWQPDSRHLIGEYIDGNDNAGKRAVVIDALTNRISQILPFSQNVSVSWDKTVMIVPGKLLEISLPDATNASNTLSIETWFSENAPAEIREYGLDKALHITRKWSVSPPHDTSIGEVTIAPTGDRIAWLVESVHVDPALDQLHRLLPLIKVPSQPRQELWICRLDGTVMREVGQTPTKIRNGYPLQIYDIRWLPDGRHLSFAYDGALWTVPAKQ